MREIFFFSLLFPSPHFRTYIQPQWVFDSVNTRRLLPVDDYLPGASLPPHLSPFVEEREGDYVPPERRQELLYQETGEVMFCFGGRGLLPGGCGQFMNYVMTPACYNVASIFNPCVLD